MSDKIQQESSTAPTGGGADPAKNGSLDPVSQIDSADVRSTAGDPDEPGSAEIARPRVDIYVADHCMVCEYAHEVAEGIRSDFPQVELSVVNLSRTTEDVPELVFATPTYLLNGRLWSLGNPSPEDVQRRLAQALGQYVPADGEHTNNHDREKSEQ